MRVLLNDNDPDGIYAYEDEQLLDALATTVDMGRVPGFIMENGGIVPDLLPAIDPTNFTRLCLWAVRFFIVDRSRVSFNTRAFSESIGQPFELVDALLNDLYKLEHGDQCL